MALLSTEQLLHFFAWFLNVASSVLIVVVNKYVMSASLGYGFVYATTLCALHFGFCALTTKAFEVFGYAKAPGPLPFWELLLYASVASTGIAFANLSLLLNSIGFYQIAKLLIAPLVCAIEFFFMGTVFNVQSMLSIGLVVVGVGIVTVTDVTTKLAGILVALVFVVFSALQQIHCGFLQKKHSMSSSQLLAKTSPLQFALVGTLGPSVDYLVTKSWVFDYDYSVGAVVVITLSCAVSVLVNVSQYMCLGRFSATTYSVMGHAKTVAVLVGGVVLFKEHLSFKELSGMVLAIAGMVAYSYFASKPSPGSPKKAGHEKDEALQPLLQEKVADVESHTPGSYENIKTTATPSFAADWYQTGDRRASSVSSRA